MSTEEKGKKISNIMIALQTEAKLQNKQFDGGDVFFSLTFKTDGELNRIAKLCGVNY